MKQKGFMVVFLLVFGLWAWTGAANASDTLAPGSGYVNNGSSKSIYTQPDTGSDVIGILPTGQDFEILSVQETWLEIACYHLASGREVGWITSMSIAQDIPYSESLHNQPTVPLVTQQPSNPTQPSQPQTQAQTPSPQTQPSGVIQGYGFISNGGATYPVKVYSQANTRAKVMGAYYQGVEAAYYGNTSGGWVKISVGNIQGYISANNFSIVNSEVTPTLPVCIVSNTTSPWVNLRTEPSLSAGKLGEYYNGRVALVYGTVGDWTYLKVEGKTGYIMTQYLKTMTPKLASSSAMREYQVFLAMPDYKAQASAYEVQPGEFNVQVELEFGPSYSTNSPITSYNVYINGAYAGNIQPVNSSGTVVSPKEFQGYANFDGEIVSIMLIPLSQPDNEEFNAEILAFG